MSASAVVPAGRTAPLVVRVFAMAFLAVAFYQACGACQDWVRALAFRYELDYGEGIVWQQALLMFGPRMYSPSTALPFVVFHYPPLYHFGVRGLMAAGLDPLMAGRLLSITASLVLAVSVAGLVLLGTRERPRLEQVVIAVAIGLMALCLNPIFHWGVLMRVDTLAVALGLVGTVVFVLSRGSLLGMTASLLICVAAVFTKQTQLPAGVAIFGVALLCAPRRALVASLIAGGVGLAAVALLQAVTGGFLQNIVGYNVNPIDLPHAVSQLRNERENWAVVLLMLVAAVKLAWSLTREPVHARLRQFDPASVARTVMLAHFALACLSALQIIKDGSSSNYFIDMLASGCVVVGQMLCARGETAALTCTAIAILGLTTAKLRHEHLSPQWMAAQTAEMTRLVPLVAAQTKPVMSDDMVLLMRAGKSVVFEPEIVRVLVAGHRWDPSQLLAMINGHGFAFAVTHDQPGGHEPPVTAAIEAAYPRAQPTTTELTIRLPSP